MENESEITVNTISCYTVSLFQLKYIINSFVLFPLMHGKEDMYLTCVWEHGKVSVFNDVVVLLGGSTVS